MISASIMSPEQCRAIRAAMPEVLVSIQAGNRNVALKVRLADTRERHLCGFQYAAIEEMGRPIMFDYGRDVVGQFHMRNLAMPLDIAFIKDDGRLFEIQRMLVTPTERYGPSSPFRWALEAHFGFFSERGIQVGAQLVVPALVAAL